MENNGKVRLTFDLSVGETLALGKIAASRGCSVTQALGGAIQTSSFLAGKAQSGSRVLLRSGEGAFTELRLPG